MTQPEPITPPAEPAAPQVAAPAPPWGSDENFDPQRAWNLIQNLRSGKEQDELRRQIAELQPLAAKARELEEAQKTEQQRLAEQLAAAQQEAATYRGQALRMKVATEKGVPAALVGRLQGSTEEELAADADALLAAFPRTAPVQPAGQRAPIEALRPGSLPNPPEPTLAERIAAAEAAGRFTEAMSLKNQQLASLWLGNDKR